MGTPPRHPPARAGWAPPHAPLAGPPAPHPLARGCVDRAERARAEPARDPVAAQDQLTLGGPSLERLLLERGLHVPLHGPQRPCRVLQALRAFGHGFPFGLPASSPSCCNTAYMCALHRACS